ncbi:chloride channel protein [Streptomyces thinghirensis]|nr:chloride channel protein [Streptomyces thinghirensis]
MTTQPAPTNAVPARAEQSLRRTLLSPGYLRLLLLCVLLGVPIALACFFFVGLQHEFQHWVWTSLPEAAGVRRPALVVAAARAGARRADPGADRDPDAGRRRPSAGERAGRRARRPPRAARRRPGGARHAAARRGAGPRGPADGRRQRARPAGGAAGGGRWGTRGRARSWPRPAPPPRSPPSSAGRVVAAVLLIEGAGLGGAQLVALLLPCLLASATGALVFTGFGQWTGLKIGALALHDVPPGANPDAGDFLWGVPTAALIAVLITVGRELGHRTVSWTRHRTALRTVACATAVGVCLSAYALITGRSPAEAALSGQATLARLAADPHAWSVGALVALVACKGLAWGIALGSLRGGPIFPAVLLGTATAMACSGLPGFGVTPALALGISAAAAAVTGLPLASAVLAVLLVGGDAYDQMPLIVTASVVAFVVTQLVRRTEPGAGAEPPKAAPETAR